MNFAKWNRDDFLVRRENLQKMIDETPGNLGEKLGLLHAQQVSIGFVQDELKKLEAFSRTNPRNDRQRLLMQYNPERAKRTGGAGRREPPNGFTSINDGCYLCRENVIWQQKGLEMWYEMTIDERVYAAMCNPFPLANTHMTIALGDHEPQGWVLGDPEKNHAKISMIVNDMLRIVSQMPGYIIFFNGRKAGATIEKHLHYQAIERIKGQSLFPIEEAAQEMVMRGCRTPLLLNEYPIITIYFNGDRDSIKDKIVKWMFQWSEFCGHGDSLSANIIACLDKPKTANSKNTYHVYLIPRDAYYSSSPGRDGVVGGLEVLGEIAFSLEKERERIGNAQIDYDDLAAILKSVEPHMARTFFELTSHTVNI
jgi:hypothetical protein